MSAKKFLSLKVDVDTHDGMRDGVPRLLKIFKKEAVRATLFLSFGPDNAGRAVLNIFRQKGFLKKMVRTGAPSLYGLRTILSGTLLPARPIATKFPEIVRQIEAEGHECEIHAWDHRAWQDHIETLKPGEIEAQFQQAGQAYEAILGHAARAVAAPSWKITPPVLAFESKMNLSYASDLRNGSPCYLKYGSDALSPLQIPTTGPCLEELLTLGEKDPKVWCKTILATADDATFPVLALHAEVEGGPYADFLKLLLDEIKHREYETVPLQTVADTLLEASKTSGEAIPVRNLGKISLAGRAGWVSTAVPVKGTSTFES